jgi:hypothetical protein
MKSPCHLSYRETSSLVAVFLPHTVEMRVPMSLSLRWIWIGCLPQLNSPLPVFVSHLCVFCTHILVTRFIFDYSEKKTLSSSSNGIQGLFMIFYVYTRKKYDLRKKGNKSFAYLTIIMVRSNWTVGGHLPVSGNWSDLSQEPIILLSFYFDDMSPFLLWFLEILAVHAEITVLFC